MPTDLPLTATDAEGHFIDPYLRFQEFVEMPWLDGSHDVDPRCWCRQCLPHRPRITNITSD